MNIANRAVAVGVLVLLGAKTTALGFGDVIDKKLSGKDLADPNIETH